MARPRATRNPAQKNQGPSCPNLSGFGLFRKPPIDPGLWGCFFLLSLKTTRGTKDSDISAFDRQAITGALRLTTKRDIMSQDRFSGAPKLSEGHHSGIADLEVTPQYRREFCTTLLAFLVAPSPLAAQQQNLPGLPINNSGPSQPQLGQAPVCERIQDPRIAAILLGVRPSPPHPMIQIQRAIIESNQFNQFETILYRKTPYAIGPAITSQSEPTLKFTIPAQTMLVGDRKALTAFNIPDRQSPEATRKRLKARSAPTQTFVMLAEIVEGMKAYRSQNPQAASCEVIIGRSTDNFKGRDTVVYRSIPFDLKNTPEVIDSHLKKIIAGLQKDREDWEHTGKHTDAGYRATEMAEGDPIFFALYRVAAVIDLRVKSEIIKEDSSQLTVTGVVTGNSGNGKINQMYKPLFAIVDPDQLQKIAQELSESTKVPGRPPLKRTVK
jgi:hypothetical protein